MEMQAFVKKKPSILVAELQARYVYKEVLLSDIQGDENKRPDVSVMKSVTVHGSTAASNRSIVISKDSVEVEITSDTEELSFVDCDDSTYDWAGIKLSELPNLRSITFDGLRSLSDGVLTELTSAINNLRVLRINRCPTLTTRSLNNLLSNNVGIIDLDLSLMPKLDDAYLADGISKLKRIQHVSLDASPRLGSSCANALANNCEFLRSASFSGSATLETASFDNLTKRCPLLEELAICGCELVNLDTIENLFLIAKNLQILDVSLISGVPQEGVQALRSRGITVIHRPKVTAWSVPRLLPDPPPVVEKKEKKPKGKGGKKSKKR